jgi:hypothetical protein
VKEDEEQGGDATKVFAIKSCMITKQPVKELPFQLT